MFWEANRKWEEYAEEFSYESTKKPSERAKHSSFGWEPLQKHNFHAAKLVAFDGSFHSMNCF